MKVQVGEDLFDKMSNQMGAMMDAMLDEMNSGSYFRCSGRASWEPAINLYEIPKLFVICVDLAGMELDKIDVTVEGRVLHVRGDRPKPYRPELTGDISVHLMEINSGQFHRKLSVPGDVEMNGISASYHHGYLWILLPRQ